MPDYSRGKIYTIWDSNYTKCYIGSTIQQLSKRMQEHRSSYKTHVDDTHGCNSVFDLFDEFGVENCRIELLETFACNNKEELLAREGQCIRENECVNKRIAGRTGKQYYDDNRDRYLQYREEHRETQKEYDKDRYERKKDEIKERQKQYRKDNLEYVREQEKKRYYENRQDKLQATYTCECGQTIKHRSKWSHQKTLKHLQYIKSLEETN